MILFKTVIKQVWNDSIFRIYYSLFQLIVFLEYKIENKVLACQSQFDFKLDFSAEFNNNDFSRITDIWYSSSLLYKQSWSDNLSHTSTDIIIQTPLDIETNANT